MDALVELAEKLGKMIAASPAASRLRRAKKALNQEADTSKTLEDFRRQSEKLAKLEDENKPIEVEDKHLLRDLREKLLASETFKEFTGAQVEYVDLMRKVNEALQKHLNETDQD